MIRNIIVFCFFCLTRAYLNNELLSISITRHHKGDIFFAKGDKCYRDLCVGLTSGTATPNENGECECKCVPHLPVFRDDFNICVDDIQECTLLPFAIGSTVKKIPYVFLPLKGQIVYPSAEIVMSDMRTPVCVVSGAQFLGKSGWLNLRNNSGTETPFRLFRDEERTYLQWFGDAHLRTAMEGRIILVHMMCKDASNAEEPKIHTPCIGFRVAGNPTIREVLFSTDVHLREGQDGGLSVREYIAIGICSLLLGVVYVASVFLYLHLRKRRKNKTNESCGGNAQLTLGEEGIVKNNPLLQASQHLSGGGQDNDGYITDSNSCCSDADHTSDLLCLEEEDPPGHQNVQTSAIIHPCGFEYGETILNQDASNIEKLPEENVSIVETLEIKEDHPETIKAMASANGRRKLYFNPSYFELDLLKAPPPAALEFLIKIREVIAIAKHKMSVKKFSPSLLGIPEEDGSSKADHDGGTGAKNKYFEGTRSEGTVKSLNSTTSANIDSVNLRFVSGDFCCPSDAKQRIIRKWLEDVPVMTMKSDELNAKSKEMIFRKAKSEENMSCKKCRPDEEKKDEVGNTNKEKDCKAVPVPPVRQDKKRPKPRAPPLPPLQNSQKSQDETACKDSKKSGGKQDNLNKTEFANVSCKSLNKIHDDASSEPTKLLKKPPPCPPPLPVQSNVDSEAVPRAQRKDRVPPAVAKNLMDAVIQELSGFKKNDKPQKSKNVQESYKPLKEANIENNEKNNKEVTIKKNKGVEQQNFSKTNLESNDCVTESKADSRKDHVNDTVKERNAVNSNAKKMQEKVGIQDDHEYEIILLNPDLKPLTDEKPKDLKIYNLPEILSKSDRNEGYSLVSEVYVNDVYSCCSSGESPPSSYSNSSIRSDKIRYEVLDEKPGRLTIHVNDSSESYKGYAGESDNFEPDTLDRKPHKLKLVQKTSGGEDEPERYSNQRFHDMDPQKNSNNSNRENFTDSLERPSIMLKSNGSFKKDSFERDIDDLFKHLDWTKMDNCGSLREIFEAKSKNHRRKTETRSLVDSVNSDIDCISSLSWNEERRNKLLHRGIVLHISEEGNRKHKKYCKSHMVKNNYSEKIPSRSEKPRPKPRSRPPSPSSRSNCTSPTSKFTGDFPTTAISPNSTLSHGSLSPPVPPPRSVPISPPPPPITPRSASSSPLTTGRESPSRKSERATPPPRPPSNNSIVDVCAKTPGAQPSRSCRSPSPSSILCSVPPRPPKENFQRNTPPLPPRNSKPPLPPKNSKTSKQKPIPSKFATRPLPPLPFPRPIKDLPSPSASCKDFETSSILSGASMDSLNSSEYEAFYTLPYEEEEGTSSGKDKLRLFKNSQNLNSSKEFDEECHPRNHLRSQRSRDCERRGGTTRESNKAIPHRPDDSGYLSTDSNESCCHAQLILTPHIPRIPEQVEPYGGQNSETEESFCDGASESGAESIATDSFFYGNFNKTVQSSDGNSTSEVYPYSLRLSDVEVNSDTERHCVPIMVRP